MTYLIVSDIHANLEALDAVVADARGRYDRIACLGDLVGYGADPNAVVEWSQANVAVVIRGNHDKACVGLDDLENYNPAARASAIWTRSALTPESREYLEKLPRGPLVCEGADLAHGSPADEDEYLATPHDAELLRPFLGNALSFFGHTHVQGGFLLSRGKGRRILPNGTVTLQQGHQYLVNPGSVGQPRDGNPRAAYAFFHPEQGVVEYRRVPYDVSGAAAKILAAGLPEFLATRLYEGL